MNIFCYRRTVRNPALSSMLGVPSGLVPQFGFRPEIPLQSGRTGRTEIDMKLGDLMVEAKLTETDFQTAPAGMIETYRDLGEVFDSGELMMSGDVVPCYQLIRGVLRCLCDGRIVLRSLRCEAAGSDRELVFGHAGGPKLRSALPSAIADLAGLAAVLPNSLQKFLAAKYGIVP
jgi:hypothetical protein